MLFNAYYWRCVSFSIAMRISTCRNPLCDIGIFLNSGR
ncbi:Uncharacterized protein ToN1_28220 [Aromatoleum petrolei]|nr:Uncharacterized protein ToN1_28220 [Aromatoleum petrolei]